MVHADLATVLTWRNHPDVRRVMFNSDIIEHADHVRWFDRAGADALRRLMVFERAGTPSGFVQLSFDPASAIGEWGFYAAPGAPKGTGRAMAKLALDYAFTDLKMHKMTAEVIESNSRSVDFHRRLGFVQEGFLRDQFKDAQGYHGVFRFGLLANEWLWNEDA
ncbi:MAG: UDP-4-amino-4,6-dideoxy-N-acetyl-beta-L-altrosamine N-acetyltransferase [Burkholderiaceae bacterium]|nr:UDP-4-amino-4,6-dideoxy-N-acetyl-beta-L-altrosamine N-acetyltransferase [Burkholderiaceae bacterium]